MKTLVLGASTNPERYSYKAIEKLLQHNHEVVAIGQKTGTVFSVAIQTEKVNFEAIDTVTLYLNPTRQEAYYSYIISLQPKRVIFNPGTENPTFYKQLEQHSIQVEVACTLVLLAINHY